MMPGKSAQFTGPGSVNIFLTNYCNRSCPFCYLNNWITNDGKQANYISETDLDKIINWVIRSRIKKIKLAGGEPMLHPKVVDFIKKIIDNKIIVEGILTNGLGKTDSYKEIANLTDTNWLVNVGKPETYSKNEWNLLNNNLEIMRWKNKDRSVKKYGFDTSSLRHLCLSITFYEIDQDYDYIIELAKKYECPVIRYDVSRPSSDKSNIFVDFEKLIKIKPTLIDFVKKCTKEGIKAGVDDALPFCIFSQEELKFLHLFSNFYSICIPHSDVFPDLTVAYCTSMRDVLPTYRIQNKTAGEMFREFFSKANEYRKYKLDRCNNCYNYDKNYCQGYCLRYKADYFENKKEDKKEPKWKFWK